jgi:hypothetical protein
MPSRSEKIKTRFTEFDPWNHRLRVALFLPVFYVLGYATAILAMARSVRVHRRSSVRSEVESAFSWDACRWPSSTDEAID